MGFEVGIHDLKHDGHLFASSRGFKQRAAQINHYAREWGAAGFRSGFMMSNLDWLHELEVQYDASTFDTDPSEPQPNGGNTIFPFWVPRANGASGQRRSIRFFRWLRRVTLHVATGFDSVPLVTRSYSRDLGSKA